MSNISKRLLEWELTVHFILRQTFMVCFRF